MATAVIVNDRGEAFVGWRSRLSFAENGWESYYSVPYFAKPRILRYEGCTIWPSGVPRDRPWVLDRPYVFSSERAAARAMGRMVGFGRFAVVS